jgi:translation initiation factor 2 beta subunit (eIF-2beta)/eIF-5
MKTYRDSNLTLLSWEFSAIPTRLDQLLTNYSLAYRMIVLLQEPKKNCLRNYDRTRKDSTSQRLTRIISTTSRGSQLEKISVHPRIFNEKIWKNMKKYEKIWKNIKNIKSFNTKIFLPYIKRLHWTCSAWYNRLKGTSTGPFPVGPDFRRYGGAIWRWRES